MFGHVCSNMQTLAGIAYTRTQLQLGWLDKDRQNTLPCLNYTFGPAIGFKLLLCCTSATETGKKKNTPTYVLNGQIMAIKTFDRSTEYPYKHKLTSFSSIFFCILSGDLYHISQILLYDPSCSRGLPLFCFLRIENIVCVFLNLFVQ